MRKLSFVYAFLFVIILHAQELEVRGILINTFEEPLSGYRIRLVGTENEVTSNAQGFFTLPLPPNFSSGVLLVQNNQKTEIQIPIVKNETHTINLGRWIIDTELHLQEDQAQPDWEALLEEDAGFDRGQIGSVLQSQRDVFLNTVAFQFSPTFYRLRGLDNSNQEVRLNGLVMQSYFKGSPQWSQWGGLNDFTNRGQRFYYGTTGDIFGFGGFLSTTQFDLKPSEFRNGSKISQAFSNNSYRFRTMFSTVKNFEKRNIGIGFLLSRRWGEQGYVEGTSYDAWSGAFLVEKIWNPNHQSGLTVLFTPNRRGKSAPLTQEVFDLKGRQYNPYWGLQEGKIRNSRRVHTETPILILNHRWQPKESSLWQVNTGMVFGRISSSRLGYNGHELSKGILKGGGRNPDPVYYQNLPSFALRTESNKDFSRAYHLQQDLIHDGQLNWGHLYESNQGTSGYGIYNLYDDAQRIQQFQLGIQQSQKLKTDLKLFSELRITREKSTFFAQPIDLLGASFLWDFNPYASDISQVPNQLQSPNIQIDEHTPFQYHYDLNTHAFHFASTLTHEARGWKWFLGFETATRSYQREGIFQNGSYPDHSLAASQTQNFFTYGVKGGISYALTGRHHFALKGQSIQKPPSFSNVYSNPREHSFTIPNSTYEKNKQLSLSYKWQGVSFDFNSELFWIKRNDLQEVGFYFADGVGGDTALFVQEITQGMAHRHLGLICSFSYMILPDFKVETVASVGDFRYANNPNIYLGTAPSDSATQLAFDQGIKSFGKSSLKNYKLAGGPHQAFSVSFHYEDPNFWRLSVYGNYFSNAYLDPNPLLRTANFNTDQDGLLFADYDLEQAARMLKQEQFPSYFLLNANGGKSWRLGDAYAGFFISIQNILDILYKTGGYEQGRNANYRSLKEDFDRELPLFSPKYWWGRGSTYFITTYYRF